MKRTAVSAAREISHWRNFFRTRDAALKRAGPSAADAIERADAEFEPTEWAETLWPDTDINPDLAHEPHQPRANPVP